MKIFQGNSWLMKVAHAFNFKRMLLDKVYLGMKYRRDYGEPLRWDNPDTFQAKLQWLKVYNRQTILTNLVDKYEVKKIVSKK